MTTLNQALLTNASATGNPVAWSGGYCAVSCEGTFNGGSATLQAQSANGTWIDVGANTTFSAAGWGGAFLPPCNIRMAISGAPSAMYAYANQMPTPTSQYTMGN
jgi:hypothetical protein